ncbi:MAG: hypothetical protein OSJ72_17050 [Lachnospiraceae bacterium]|nr:hypothetical protein [Lachnospiraceae bacterium]
MSDLLKTAEKEILRKEILGLCYKAAPTGCSMDVLAAAFAHSGTGDKDEIARQVDYLEAKHLVLVQKVGNERLGISKQIVKLTAEGIDYMEGNADQLTGIGE